MECEYFETPIGNYYLPNYPPRDVVTHYMKHGEVFEPEIIEIGKRFIKKNSVVLDIGAHYGQMSIIFSSLVGESGRVYSFEAADDIFEILERNIAANRCTNVISIFGAVFDSVGEKKFYPKPDFSRFGSWGSYGLDPRAKEGRTVETLTIDSLDIREPVSFMKVDIQGSDLFAMRGARETIMRHRMPIIFEYEVQFQEEFGTTFDDHLKFIESIDYRVVDIISNINYLIVPKEFKYASIVIPLAALHARDKIRDLIKRMDLIQRGRAAASSVIHSLLRR